MLEYIDIREFNLDYPIDDKYIEVIPDKRVLVYQRNIEVPKKILISSALYFTIRDLLKNNNLEVHLDNILYIFNDTYNNLSVFRQRIKIFKAKKAYNSFTDIDELSQFISIFKQKKAELLQITIKSNVDGVKHDITLKSKEIIDNIFKLIINDIGEDNIANTKYYEEKKKVSDSFDTNKYYDFMVFAMCKYFFTYFKKNCKKMKKYTIYFYVGQIFVVLNLLDTEVKFNQKNYKKYNYLSYYKYLTDNINNILNRMPDFYRKSKPTKLK